MTIEEYEKTFLEILRYVRYIKDKEKIHRLLRGFLHSTKIKLKRQFGRSKYLYD
jgi:hypothetical protein